MTRTGIVLETAIIKVCLDFIITLAILKSYNLSFHGINTLITFIYFSAHTGKYLYGSTEE